MSMLDRPSGEVRETETFPAVQRGGIKFFRRMTRGFIAFFRQIGARGYFLRDIGRAFGDPATFTRRRSVRCAGSASIRCR